MCAKRLFVCTQCGDCCKGYGGTYVAEADIEAIAQFVGISADQLRTSHCVQSGGRLVLSQRPDGYCIFWDGNCTIHDVKPRMCRNWPFIQSVVMDPSNWRIMARVCPGMDGSAADQEIVAYVQSLLDQSQNEGDQPA